MKVKISRKSLGSGRRKWFFILLLGVILLGAGYYFAWIFPGEKSFPSEPGVPSREPIVTPPPEPKRPSPRIAIIIDDLGFNIESAQMVINLEIPLTVSILPFYSYTKQSAELANQAGIEILLHLPLEPVGYLDSAYPGPGVLLCRMSEEEISQQLEKDLRAVPFISGVSSHMGSRFTSDLRAMKTVFIYLKQRSLFFVDNLTTSKSVGDQIAREVGLRFIQRDVFLDHDLDRDLIAKQLDQAERLAAKFGEIVAVGHPHQETISALKNWIPGAEARGISFVQVSEFLKEQI